MNYKRVVISVISVFIFIFVLDFLVHGILLKEAYSQTAHLWRAEAEMKMGFMLISQFGVSLMLTTIFVRNYESKGIAEGFRFGGLVGLLLMAIIIGGHAYMPISFSLTLSWMIASLLKGVGSGLILALTYRDK